MIYGNWAITWPDSDHAGVDRQHLLQAPLQRIRPGVRVNKHTATSLDETVQNTIVFGSAKLITAKLKGDLNAASLADLLEAGIKGVTLTLRDLDQTDRGVAVYLVDPDDLWLAMYDTTGTPWEFEAELTFRRTDGSTFPDWVLYQAYGTEGLLYKYTAGMDLSGATFTRAASANYINVSGATTAAATNVARDAHYQTIASTWTRSLRLESAESEVLQLADWDHGPQVQTIYIRFVEQGTRDSANGVALYVSPINPVGDTPRFLIYVLNDTYYRAFLHNGVGSNTSLLAVSPTVGDLVELRLVITATGITLGQSINGAAETTAGENAVTLPSSWGTAYLWVGTAPGGATYADMDVGDIKVLAGVHSMAACRER